MEYRISVKAELTIWYVDGDNVTGPWNGTKEHPYQNITNALEHAIDGDTIFVHNGMYFENVIVNISVSIVGEDRSSTIVDGNGTINVISIRANNVSIQNFTIKNSGPDFDDCGIFVDGSSRVNISHNTISNNNNGIKFSSSVNSAVSSNTMSNNDYHGIVLQSSSNNVISGNILRNNFDGIGLHDSINNVVSSNTMSNNDYDGIVLQSSSNNVISGNTISNNNVGMDLAFHSKSNIIYHNNFDNVENVRVDSTSMNVWDYGNEGNYWSDYDGTDLNCGSHQNVTGSDGIGDIPYTIDKNNQDNSPLMGIFSNFHITLEGETYCVSTICNSTIFDFKFEVIVKTRNRIIRFNVTGENGTVGFCRVRIPTELMKYSHIVLAGNDEVSPTLLDVSNETYVYLYFTYSHKNYTITIIYSEMLYLYDELLDNYLELQADFYNLNMTYYGLLNNYLELQADFYNLNVTYYSLTENYSQLQESFSELNNSYQEHLLDYSENTHNIRNLMYMFAATTAIFLITTVYLSKHANKGIATRTKVFKQK